MADIELPEPDGDSKDRGFYNAIAIAVAIISAFMAVSKVKDDNIVQAMQKAQVETVDNWNVYQARTLRMFSVLLAIEQLKATQPESEARNKTVAEWQKQADTFKARAEEAATKAKARQADYDAGNTRDDLFDLSDALLSVALAMFAVTALVRVRWLFGAASVLGVGGMVFGVGGFNNWVGLHDAVKVLTDFLS